MWAREGGMTLLEVLVAMMVLALGVFMAAALQVRGLQASDNARREGQALQLLQGMLERVRAAGALSAADQAAWQVQVPAVLGASAEGRVSHSAGWLMLEVHWSVGAERQMLGLQGRALP
ncbi:MULTISPECIES: type IV pilus modification protein PilV [Pseudomonas]|uniref:Type IV pilus modification protein PilV n=1 Tax=Pseudomonas oryziphila TaxID=2894079 RepID=A0ABM7CLK9_9PSED|nr:MULTISPECIES: type IV pilus modification protein PilV [Pseudomonas]AZL72292.1 type IV pilus modification protein PilV [Pseudomonas oryziphila]